MTDAIARAEEGTPAGERRHKFNFAEFLADTPELVDRTEGPLTDPGTEASYVIADVVTKAIADVFPDDDDHPDARDS